MFIAGNKITLSMLVRRKHFFVAQGYFFLMLQQLVENF